MNAASKVAPMHRMMSAGDPSDYGGSGSPRAAPGYVSIVPPSVPWWKFAWHKYTLLIMTIPLVAIPVIARAILDNVVPGFNGFYAIGDVTLVITGGIFLIGFMLGGVVSDYKESEKLPGEIASCLNSIEDAITSFIPLKTKNNPKYTPAAMRATVLGVTNEIFYWLGSGKKRDDGRMFAACTRLSEEYISAMYDTAPPISVRLNQEVVRLRGAMTRVAVISASRYLPSGYALVELFVLMANIIVVFARYGTGYNAYAVICGVAIIYGSMLRLMRDIDDPFEYDAISDDAEAEGQDGSTEVMLDILLDYRKGLKARLAADLAKEQAATTMVVQPVA